MRWRRSSSSSEELDFAGTGGGGGGGDPSPVHLTVLLRLCLVDTMHVLYLEALARLPAATARRHIRGLMLAGHCYGLLDPVSNIVLNSIWYDIAFPAPPPLATDEEEEEEEGDVLDSRCLLRLERRSVDGLVALVVGAATAPVS
ncbi:unnamed protein product [Urochloa humidicola]